MKNKLRDLNNALFMQLERLQDDEIFDTIEKAELELKRTKAVCDVSSKIIDLTDIQLEGIKIANEWNIKAMPDTLGIEQK